MNSIRGGNYSLVYQCKCAVKPQQQPFGFTKSAKKLPLEVAFLFSFLPNCLLKYFFSKTEKMLKTFHLFLAHPVVLQLIVPSMEQLSKIAK